MFGEIAPKQVTQKTGTGVVAVTQQAPTLNSPIFVTPTLGTPASGNLANCTGYPGANPTASVGTAAVNGSAATFLRSDGAPAIDQTMVPTWTGLHTFSGNVVANQKTDGDTALKIVRKTDTSPTGLLIEAINAALNSDVFTVDVSGNVSCAQLTTGASAIIVGSPGVKITDQSAAHYDIIRGNSSSALTADRTLTLDLANASSTLKISANSTLNQDVSTAGTPSFSTVTLGTGGVLITDQSAAHNAVIKANSSTALTADRTLTLDLANVSSTLKLAANLTITAAATVSNTNTGDQTITLTGNVTGSGTGSFATTIAAGVVTNAMLAGSILNTKLTAMAARVYNSGNISINSGTNTALTFDSERYDSDSLHSTVTNTSRITIPTGGAGVWMLGGAIAFAGNVTGYRYAALRVNGATYIAICENGNLSTTGLSCVSCSYTFADADYIELIGFQNSGGALNVTASANYSPEFWAYRVGG